MALSSFAGTAFPSGPSFKGIELLSRTIMTGKNLFRNKKVILQRDACIHMRWLFQNLKKTGSGWHPDPVLSFTKTD